MPITPTGGAVAILKFGSVTAPGKNWKLSRDFKVQSAANFADGRLNFAGLADADFECDMIYNTASMPHDPAGLNLIGGTAISASCYVSVSKFYLVPIMVSNFDLESEIEGILTYKVKGKLNGAITDPVIA